MTASAAPRNRYFSKKSTKDGAADDQHNGQDRERHHQLDQGKSGFCRLAILFRFRYGRHAYSSIFPSRQSRAARDLAGKPKWMDGTLGRMNEPWLANRRGARC